MSNNAKAQPNNGSIYNVAQIIKVVMSSAAEAELGALFINAREAVHIRNILEQIGHQQPLTQYKLIIQQQMVLLTGILLLAHILADLKPKSACYLGYSQNCLICNSTGTAVHLLVLPTQGL